MGALKQHSDVAIELIDVDEPISHVLAFNIKSFEHCLSSRLYLAEESFVGHDTYSESGKFPYTGDLSL